MKCVIVAGMRRGCQEQEMPRPIVGEFPKQIETPVARLPTRDRGVGFIHNDHLRACAQKVVETPFAF